MMIEREIDLWELECDVRCITTNGTVDSMSAENIMGAGCAGEAVRRHPWLPQYHGMLIQENGQHVFLCPGRLVMFPTIRELGEGASLELVVRSSKELLHLADIYEWERIALPRPGAGLGGLEWGEVKEILEPELDDRFIIVSYPQP